LAASPYARRVAAEQDVDINRIRGTGPGGRITSEDVIEQAEGARATTPLAAPSVPPPGVTSTAPASIAARQLADLLGIDLAAVPVDPNERRVTRQGVARHVRDRLATPSAGVAGSAADLAPPLQPPTEVIRLSGMRGTIAKRMHSSLQQMAQLTLTMDAPMDRVVADRAARKATGTGPGYTDYIIAATGRALRRHPRMNAQITTDGIALLAEVHVGMAVALDEGLIVPVVRNADQVGLHILAGETTRLAEAARSGQLGPDEVAGGTFSVTALGMFGVDAFTPVINPPNVGILGVGRLREELQLVDRAITPRWLLTLSLTWDHRAVDGAPAAEFVQTICALLQDPEVLFSPT
jgi:pyruvate dehydrogenase E2 component (dihydrolipoamide acetyltransferase)